MPSLTDPEHGTEAGAESGAEAGPEPYHERPSKTQRKKVSHDLQDLGEAAVALPDTRLVGLAISEVLLDAIHNYKKTKTFEGRRRQMQYIGKLMRSHDVEPLRQAVTDRPTPSETSAAASLAPTERANARASSMYCWNWSRE